MKHLQIIRILNGAFSPFANNMYHQQPYQQNPQYSNPMNYYPNYNPFTQGNPPFVNNIYVNGSGASQGYSPTSNILD